MRREWLALIALIPLLSACGGSSGSAAIKSVSTRPAPARPSGRAPVRAIPAPIHRAPPPAAPVQMIPGLEGVIGATAPEIIRQFGTARLDVWEGDARKLQFSGVPCVLDVYLYPAAPGREPQASYVDARRKDGRDVDRAACVAALRPPPAIPPAAATPAPGAGKGAGSGAGTGRRVRP